MAEIPRAGAEETDAAIERARRRFQPGGRWTRPIARRCCTTSPTRSPERQEDLAKLEARNAGKPISDARGEMGMVVETFRYYAGAPERLTGKTIPVSGGVDMTFREPLGVVGLITPWNFPLTIASWKVAPALAAGNTIVLKPAELTPLTASSWRGSRWRPAFRKACSTSSPGKGSVAGQRIVEHPDVAKVAFTGSTEVGRGIAESAAATIKRVTLELGGKSRQRDLRRRRPGGCGLVRPARGLRQRRPGLLRALADPGRALGDGRLHVGAGEGGDLDQGRGSARRVDRDGPGDLGRPAGDRLLLRQRRCAGRLPGLGPRRARLLVPAHRARPRSPTTTAPRARRSSARSPA